MSRGAGEMEAVPVVVSADAYSAPLRSDTFPAAESPPSECANPETVTSPARSTAAGVADVAQIYRRWSRLIVAVRRHCDQCELPPIRRA